MTLRRKRHRQPGDRLLAAFDAYEASLAAGDYRGCPFINAAAELPDPSHPAREVVAEHKQRLLEQLAALAELAGVESSAGLAEDFLILLDGGYVTGSIRRDTEPVRRARDVARRLAVQATRTDGS